MGISRSKEVIFNVHFCDSPLSSLYALFILQSCFAFLLCFAYICTRFDLISSSFLHPNFLNILVSSTSLFLSSLPSRAYQLCLVCLGIPIASYTGCGLILSRCETPCCPEYSSSKFPFKVQRIPGTRTRVDQGQGRNLPRKEQAPHLGPPFTDWYVHNIHITLLLSADFSIRAQEENLLPDNTIILM